VDVVTCEDAAAAAARENMTAAVMCRRQLAVCQSLNLACSLVVVIVDIHVSRN
jgi:hypothetical protein